MQRTIALDVIQDILEYRFRMSEIFQPISFIVPDGKCIVLHRDHYEAYQWLVMEQFAQCLPDAEILLSDLGYIPYSYEGYITLAYKEPTKEQYETLAYCLRNIAFYKQRISLYVSSNTRYSIDLELRASTVNSILKRIKKFYRKGVLKNV